jgi:hypothetical protein
MPAPLKTRASVRLLASYAYVGEITEHSGCTKQPENYHDNDHHVQYILDVWFHWYELVNQPQDDPDNHQNDNQTH